MQKEWSNQKEDGRKVIIDYEEGVIRIFNETFVIGFWGNKKKPEVCVSFSTVSLGFPITQKRSSLPLKTEEGELVLSHYSEMDSLVEELREIAWDNTDKVAYRKAERNEINVWKRNKLIYKLCGYFCFVMALFLISIGAFTYYLSGELLVESFSSLICILLGFMSLSTSKKIQV